MAVDYASVNGSASTKLNLLGALVGVANVGRKPFTIGSGIGEYNVNTYKKVGSGHVNKQQDLAKDMKNFLGGQNQTIWGSRGDKELLTVAQELGREGAAVQLRTIIVDQVQNPAASPHFRIMRPRQMTDAEIAGTRVEILKFGYTPPTEAPEFAPPHYIAFESEVYEGKGYRFNNGFRFNAELLLTEGGTEMMAQYARVAINNFAKLMEQIVTYCLIGVNDRYARKKLLIDSGAQTEEELMEKYKYNGELMNGSFLAYGATVGILQRHLGLEFLINWVRKVTQTQNVNITHCLVVPDSLLGLAMDRAEYQERGPEAMTAMYTGEEFTKSIIRKLNGIEIVEQPTYEMKDARIRVEQALSNIMEIGQYYVLDNTPYYKLRTVQSARGLDSKAPRVGAGINDLYYLDYSTKEVTKRCQPFADLMRAALCWDEHGELNDLVYNEMLQKENMKALIEAIGLQVDCFKTFKPDPWVVESHGNYVRVDMVGNQDVYHTSVNDTKIAVDIAHDMIVTRSNERAGEQIDALVDIMAANYQVKPDDNGNIEGFWASVAWNNVDQKKLDRDEPVWYISEPKLPALTPTANKSGVKQPINAYQRKDGEFGHHVCAFKAPVIDTVEGPKFDVQIKTDYTNFFQAARPGRAAMLLAGYVPTADGWADVLALAFIRGSSVSGGQSAAIQSVIAGYTSNYGSATGLLVPGGVQSLIDDGILVSSAGLDSDLSNFPYPKPAAGDTIYHVAGFYLGDFDFYGKDSNSLRDRLMSAYLQSSYYKAILEKERDPKYRTNIDRLRSNASRHPQYLWLDSKLVYDPTTGRGCIEGDSIVTDPTTIANTSDLPFFKSASHHSFWSTKMSYLGYKQASFFYRFEDLQRCKIFGPERGNVQLPGFSTFASMRSVASQMNGSANLHGWQNIDAQKMFKTIVAGVSAIDSFLDCCYRVFSPSKSTLTQGKLDVGTCFMADKFLHHAQSKGHVETDAKLCFANMVLPASTRNLGLISPFINYPLFANKEAADTTNKVTNGLATVLQRSHIEMSMRFTDAQDIKDVTPFIVASPSSQFVSSGLQFDDAQPQYVNRPSAYSYFSGKPSSSGANVSFNLSKAAAIQANLAGLSNEEKFVYNKFVDSLLRRLMKSGEFAYKQDIANEASDNPRGIPALSGSDRTPHLKLAGQKGGRYAKKFFAKFSALLNEAISRYPGFYDDITEYYKALTYATIVMKFYFDHCFDDPNNLEDPDTFSLRPEQADSIASEADRRVSEMEKLIAITSSSSGSSLDDASLAVYDTHLKNLHSNFASQIYRDSGSSLSAKKLYMTNMMLSVDSSYWTTLDQNMKRLYGLRYDGLGVQFSMARPQNKYDNDFIDSVWRPTGVSGSASTAGRISKYKELLDFGPGSSAPFNLETLLKKLSHGSYYDRQSKSSDLTTMLRDFDVNQHFHARYNSIEGGWRKQAIALAMLTARPTADLMINLHAKGIPQPMVLIPMDPYMTFRMCSMLFVDNTDSSAFLGHHLTFHTAGMDSDTREVRNHISCWIYPFWPRPEKVVQVPNVSFSGVMGGVSGRIVNSIARFREFGKTAKQYHQDKDTLDWNPSFPYDRHADRFVNYGGGSVTSDKLGTDLNVVGNNHCTGATLHCGIDLPLGIIPTTPNNCMAYPSALVFNLVTGYGALNSDVDDNILHPTTLQHVRANRPGGPHGGAWNVWCSRGKQFSVNYETGSGDVLRAYGSGPLADVEELDGHYLKGLPKMFKANGVSKKF